ncbi:DEAD/DEAH box helicase [Nitrospirillum sp. BR 11164]|uniref:DEAD/DEAH box helicase n=1 Tax=Nitrospirillum sp. BR 11164 TaxID=3104324 RepID=UPI002AFDD9B9|nr:DEAD/DEAH box helicase [Nitrospirillum sp. BR 11164]MEA1647792.1 DEAD/DEAH box helicase [Nitrospirillum sp. BR 11164]
MLEIVPRLSELIYKKKELATFEVALSSLARASGLWNYINKEQGDSVDIILAESVSLPELGGVTLHREQISVLNAIFSKRNVVLSAPTSFGKSLLIDALIASGRYKKLAIVLPTIALLDEFRRRLSRRFSNKFQIIMHQIDVVENENVIFLGTQERLIGRSDLDDIDLTVVDEFYKLDASRRDDRNMVLNAAVYKLLNKSKQFFFLGPNVDDVLLSPGIQWKFEFIKTRFSTVAIDTFDLRREVNKEEKLFEEIGEEANWPALVFVSSPDKANELASRAADSMAVSDESPEFAKWLAENIGVKWPVVNMVRFGFAIHHGRIPRAIASQMIRMFNTLQLPVLFCTSTLIEGVNTAAKSVFIYDKEINRRRYDFFTFSNIRGRAGRLGRHHVGRVFLFNEPPSQRAMEIAPTLFDAGNQPDDYIVHLDESDTNPALDERISTLNNKLGLDRDGLRIASLVGLDKAQRLKNLVRRAVRNDIDLFWSGNPSYRNVRSLCSLICHVSPPNKFGVSSEDQLAYYIYNLKMSATMKQFFVDHDKNFISDMRFYDGVFTFLRKCEYGIPQFFSIIELFLKAEGCSVDYGHFIRQVSRWFRPEVVKNLDEEGIPIQISEKFYSAGDSKKILLDKLTSAVIGDSSKISSFEREWIRAALELS